MSSTLSFLPRKVAASSRKYNAQAQPIVGGTKETSNHKPEQVDTPSRDASDVIQRDGKGKGKARAMEQRTSKFTNDDYAHLVSLALSDYALWSDPDLRRALDPEHAEALTPYIPLNNILERLPSSFGVVPPQTTALVGIVKALREYAGELVGARLLLQEPSLESDGWHWAGDAATSSKSLGGYELCRKDWTRENTLARLSYSRNDWHERTIYVERVPTQYRSVPGVLRLIGGLLAGSSTCVHPLTRIQGVSLPAHHQDKPGDTPTFKDFCLVTLGSAEDAQFLTTQWRWDRGIGVTNEGEIKGDVDVSKEAVKFGFRTIRKTDWDQLREEYLRYRSQLIQEINEYEDAHAGPQMIRKHTREEEVVVANTPSSNGTTHMHPQPTPLSPNAPYPYGCLVFVRNIHPETNKTTLRTLFSSVFQNEAHDTLKKDGLDYIDFNKGVDSCYLRLSTPAHTDALVLHFTKQQLIQVHGLDDRGMAIDSSSTAKPIVLEKVLNKREEVYWERVPEKVRRQAVQKMITLARNERPCDSGVELQRKKRKKG